MEIVWIWLQNGTSAKKMCLFKISQASIKHNWGNVGNKKVRAPETLAFRINVQTYFYDVAKYSWVSPVHLDNQTFHFLVRISSRELFARDSTELDRTSLKVDLDHARSPHTTLILTTHDGEGIIGWKQFLPILINHFQSVDLHRLATFVIQIQVIAPTQSKAKIDFNHCHLMEGGCCQIWCKLFKLLLAPTLWNWKW